MVGEKKLISVTLALAIALIVGVGFGQDEEAVTTAPAEKPSVESLWNDLLHYIEIGRYDGARSCAEAIIDSKPNPTAIYRLAEKMPDWMKVLDRASRQANMEEPIAGLRKIIEEGYRLDLTDPRRIRASVEMLDKGAKGYDVYSKRIKAHGEYAVPELLRQLADARTSNTLKARIITVMPSIGKAAVRPLTEALQNQEDASTQEVIAQALGEIGYWHAVPYLKELIEKKDTLGRVRNAAEKSLLACGGKGVENMSAASLFYQLAEKYYTGAESLLPDLRYSTGNVWFVRGRYLLPQPVPREIFCDIYAMRMARRALDHDPNLHAAVSLWISADLDREVKLPGGQLDPLRGQDQPAARFYALAGTPRYLKDVLERALNDFNTPVAMGALRALVRTAGSKSLIERTGGIRPLVRAMAYPDREVRFFAAVSVAQSLPKEKFDGSATVMGLLNAALRQSDGKVAVLIAGDLKQRNAFKDILRQAGFRVIDAGDVTNAMAEAQKQSGVDVVVIGSRPSAPPMIEAVRTLPIYARMPFVVADESPPLRQLADVDDKVLLIDPAAKADDLKAAVANAMARGVGRALTPEEATSWSVTAADTIRKLAQAGTTVFDLSLTQKALIEASRDKREPVQLAAIGALAATDSPEAQRTVAGLAVDAEVKDATRIAAFGNLSESVRSYGNHLTDEQAKAIIEIATSESAKMPLREAAAQAMGTLNLPSRQIVPLIKAVPEL